VVVFCFETMVFILKKSGFTHGSVKIETIKMLNLSICSHNLGHYSITLVCAWAFDSPGSFLKRKIRNFRNTKVDREAEKKEDTMLLYGDDSVSLSDVKIVAADGRCERSWRQHC